MPERDGIGPCIIRPPRNTKLVRQGTNLLRKHTRYRPTRHSSESRPTRCNDLFHFGRFASEKGGYGGRQTPTKTPTPGRQDENDGA